VFEKFDRTAKQIYGKLFAQSQKFNMTALPALDNKQRSSHGSSVTEDQTMKVEQAQSDQLNVQNISLPF